MASGDTLFVLTPQMASSPGTLAATFDVIAEGDTPAMQIPVIKFPGVTANSNMDWFLTVPSQYAGTTGFTFSYKYAVDSTDVDAVEMEFRVLPFADLDILTADLDIMGKTPALRADTPATTPTNKLNVTATVEN